MTVEEAAELFNCRDEGSIQDVRECQLDKGRQFMFDKGTDRIGEPISDTEDIDSPDDINESNADLGRFVLETLVLTEHDIDDVEEATRNVTGGFTTRPGVQRLKFKDGRDVILKTDNRRSVAYTQQARLATDLAKDDSPSILNIHCPEDIEELGRKCRMALSNSGKSTAATGFNEPLSEMEDRRRERLQRFIASQTETGRAVATQAMLGEFDREEGLGKRGERIDEFDFEVAAKATDLTNQRLKDKDELATEFRGTQFTSFFNSGTDRIIRSLIKCGGVDKLVDVGPKAMCNVANRDFNEDFAEALRDSIDHIRERVDRGEDIMPYIQDPNLQNRIDRLDEIVEDGVRRDDI